MINVTRLNGDEMVVNSDLIEFVEQNPDTIITMTTGKKIIVQENAHEIIERVAFFKNKSCSSQVESYSRSAD